MRCVPCGSGARGRAGFSLLELVIVSALMFLVLGALCAAWQVGVRSWEVTEGRTMLQQQLRRAAAYMNEDFMQCGATTISGCPADNVWYTTITFRKATGVLNGNPVWSPDEITYAAGGLNNRQIIRTEGDVQKVVANKATSFRVRRSPAAPSLLELMVGVQDEAETPSGECLYEESSIKIRLRN